MVQRSYRGRWETVGFGPAAVGFGPREPTAAAGTGAGRTAFPTPAARIPNGFPTAPEFEPNAPNGLILLLIRSSNP